MSARSKPLSVEEPVEEDTPTTVSAYQLPAEKGAVKLVDNVDELVDLLKNDAKIL
jgi:electron transfer flavoprotein beta subunit